MKTYEKTLLWGHVRTLVFPVLALLVLFFLLLPLEQESLVLSLQATAGEIENFHRLAREANLRQHNRQHFEKANQEYLEWLKGLPRLRQREEQIRLLESFGSRNGVVITRFSAREELIASALPLAGEVAFQNFELELSGSYQGVRAFLLELENNFRAGYVVSCRVERKAGAPGKGLAVTLHFREAVYRG